MADSQVRFPFSLEDGTEYAMTIRLSGYVASLGRDHYRIFTGYVAVLCGRTVNVVETDFYVIAFPS